MSSSISFILTWFAAALLLRYYARKLGRIKYWVIMALPLIWFLSQFPPTIADLMAPFRIADPILFGIVYSLLISIVKISGGIMLGLAFWRISTTIDDDLVKNFMIASAYGVLILFASKPANWTDTRTLSAFWSRGSLSCGTRLIPSLCWHLVFSDIYL